MKYIYYAMNTYLCRCMGEVRVYAHLSWLWAFCVVENVVRHMGMKLYSDALGQTSSILVHANRSKGDNFTPLYQNILVSL